MGWLVPTAAATSRSERSPMPFAATSCTTASSSSWRRSRSGGRAITAPLLASGLEAVRLQREVAPRHPAHEQTHQRTNRSALVELLSNPGAPVGFGDDFVAGHRQSAAGPLDP